MSRVLATFKSSYNDRLARCRANRAGTEFNGRGTGPVTGNTPGLILGREGGGRGGQQSGWR